MRWDLWLRGLVAATINAAVTAITLVIVDPLDFNLARGADRLLMAMLVSAILGAALYLKQHPLPDVSPEENS